MEFVLELVLGSLCPGCGARGRGAPCAACAQRAEQLRLDHGATFEDHWPARDLLRAAKFGRWGGGARWFAHRVLDGLDPRAHGIVAVSSVPSDRARVRSRGVDLPRAVARRIARELGVPYVQVLLRVRGSRTQRGLHRSERGGNARASFDVHPRAASRGHGIERGGTVLLIDDVCTTGATLRVCQTLIVIVLRRRFRDVHVRPHAITAVLPRELDRAGVSNSRSLRDKCIHVEGE